MRALAYILAIALVLPATASGGPLHRPRGPHHLRATPSVWRVGEQFLVVTARWSDSLR